MRLHKLRLYQIKSYDEAVVEFADGTNAISGPNGAGKTTILEAIGFALFDYLPYKQTQFIRDGSTSGRMVVTLQDGFGRVYEVERRVGTGATWFVYDPELRDRPAEGAADVKAWLRTQFGTDDDGGGERLFQNAVGVPQGQLTAPFLLPQNQRRDVFDPILRVNEYQDAFEALNETRAYLNDQVQKQQSLIAELSVDADRIPEFETRHGETQQEIGRLRSELGRVQAEQARADQAVALLEAQEKHLAGLKSLVSSLESALETDRRAAADAAARLERAWQAQEAVQSSARGHALYESASRSLASLEQRQAELAAHRRTADRLSMTLDQCKRDTSALTAQLATAQASERSLPEMAARAAALREHMDRLTAAETEVRRLPALREQRSRTRSELTALEARLAGARAQIASAEGRREEAEALSARQAQLDSARADRTVATEASRRLAAVRDDISRKKESLARQQAELHRLRAESAVTPEEEALAARLPHLQAELERVRAEREELQARWREIKARQTAVAESCPLSLQDCLAERRRRADELAGDLQTVKTSGTAATQLMERLQGEVERAQRAAVQVASARAQQQTLRALEDAEAQLRAEIDVLSATQGELAAYTERLPDLERTIQALTRAVESAHAATAQVASVPSLQSSLAADEQAAHSRSEEKARLDTEVRSLEERERALDELRNGVAALRGADEKYAAAQSSAAQIVALTGQLEAAQSAEAQVAASLAALQPRLAELADVEEQIHQARAERQQYEPDHRRYMSSGPLAEELPEREREAKAARDRLAASESGLAEQSRALNEALGRWDEARLRQAREQRSGLAEESGRLSGTIAGLSRELSQISQQLEGCRETLRRREVAVAERDRLTLLLDVLAFTRQTIKSAQAPVTEALLHSVSAEARVLYSAIVDDYSARLAWTPSYEITLERGRERLAFPQLSGGEQMSAALAVRLALLKRLSSIDLAFLDEPTQNMDEQRRSNLAAQVSALRGLGQLFVISHDDTFHQHVNHSILVTKQDGVSVVTVER